MSAAVAWPDAPVGPVRGRRDHLRLVGRDGGAATGESRAGRAPGGVRLTRRGRLAVTAVVALALSTVAAALVLLMAPAGAAPAEVVVGPGQTLSQLAATHLPELPLDRAVLQIQVANSLSTSDLQAGQTLLVPRP